jgi:hypothetical protein
MSENDWRENLVRRYPDLFVLRQGAKADEARGYPTVGDGWRELVEKAVERIAAALPAGSNFRVVQIKEKLATLRIHFRASDLADDALARLRDAIDLAEARSACTCEVCGAEGRPYDNDGWYLTRCKAHAEGEPVPACAGYENLFIERTLVDGKLRVARCRRYDRAHDVFVDAPLPPDFEEE